MQLKQGVNVEVQNTWFRRHNCPSEVLYDSYHKTCSVFTQTSQAQFCATAM